MSPTTGPLGQNSLYQTFLLRETRDETNTASPAQEGAGTQGVGSARGTEGLSNDELQALAAARGALGDAAKELADYIKGHPELPGLDEALLKGLSNEELAQLVTAMMDKAADTVGKATSDRLLANKDKLAKINEEKLNKIMEKIKKEKDAEPGFWGKLFGWVSKIVSAVVSVVAMVVGAALVATGAGALFGVALFALGAYMAAGVTVDVINAVRESQGKEPLSWKPTLGQLAACIAKAAGASEETQEWLKLAVDIVTDIAVGIATSIMIPGAGLMLAANRAGKVLKAGEAMKKVIKGAAQGLELADKAGKTAKTADSAANTAKAFESMTKFQVQAAKAARLQGLVETGATLGKMPSDISVALARKEVTLDQAEIKKMTALITKLQQAAEELATIVQDVETKRTDAVKRCSQMVADASEATAAITANSVSMA